MAMAILSPHPPNRDNAGSRCTGGSSLPYKGSSSTAGKRGRLWTLGYTADMNRPRLVRSLRIAWSVAWGIVCVLLILLWVRSYWWAITFGTGNLNLYIVFGAGVIEARYLDGGLAWFWQSHTISPTAADFVKHSTVLGFAIIENGIVVGTWSLVLISTAFTVIPWTYWSTRFSVRTLLIAITLLAVGLGMVGWLSR
jgi:hypothetical protein